MTLTLDFVCVFDFNAFEVTAQVTGGDTHTAVTVLLLTWTVFILDVNQKNCSVRSSTSRNTAYITC